MDPRLTVPLGGDFRCGRERGPNLGGQVRIIPHAPAPRHLGDQVVAIEAPVAGEQQTVKNEGC